MQNTNFHYFDFFFQFEKKRPVFLNSAAMMISVGCLLTNSDLFILLAEISQILPKIYVTPSLFHVSGSTESVCKQPTQLIIAAESRHTEHKPHK